MRTRIPWHPSKSRAHGNVFLNLRHREPDTETAPMDDAPPAPHAQKKMRFRSFLSLFNKYALLVLLSPWHFFKIICFLLGLVIILSTLLVVLCTHAFLHALPPVQSYTFRDLRMRAESAIHRHYPQAQHFHWEPIENVGHDLIYSLVISEDATFFEHHGFNYDALAKSLAENIRKRELAFGGSTISQQVVKNIFLDDSKTLGRKIREVILTRQLESHFSKNQILEIYLNLAEFGPNLIGVYSAAHTYFSTSPSKLNAAQGAFLAVMLPSPRRYFYAVVENRNLSSQKRKKINRILREMNYKDLISQEQYKRYLRYPLFEKLNPAQRHLATQ